MLIGIWDRNKKKRGWACVAQTLALPNKVPEIPVGFMVQLLTGEISLH
jgi:hypothetical protein